jgi:hypothetical protein
VVTKIETLIAPNIVIFTVFTDAEVSEACHTACGIYCDPLQLMLKNDKIYGISVNI